MNKVVYWRPIGGSCMSRRTLVPLSIVTILLLSSIPIVNVSANQSGGVLSNFAGGLPTFDINLDGNITNSSFGIDVPRNSTFVTAQFSVEVENTDPSPGQVWIDHGQDGFNEWAFHGTGYGDIGHQNTFSTGQQYDLVSLSGNSSSSSDFYIPFNATIADSAIDISLHPEVASDFVTTGPVIDVVSSDVDGDGLDEAVVLVENQSLTGFNTSAWAFVDWTASSGFTLSNWTSTCIRADKIETADFNNDSKGDILTYSLWDDLACLHLSNSTGFANQTNYSTADDLRKLTIGDFTRDGTPDLVSVHDDGVFSVFPWVNSTLSFKGMTNSTIYRNQSFNIAALTDVMVGQFSAFHNDTTAVVSTWRAEGIQLSWNRGAVAVDQFRFTGLRSGFIGADFDGDGDIDFASRSNTGHNMIWNNGTAWGSMGSQDLFNWNNVSVGDHDSDGVYSMFLPTPGASDGNASTLNGSIAIRDLTSSGVGFEKLITLTPESMPQSIDFVDFNGDGVAEHVVPSGESSKGLFIGGYHKISIDLENDSNPEIVVEGYAGDDSTYPLLSANDTTGNVSTALSNYILAKSPWQDSYGNEFVSLNFTTYSRGLGDVNITILDIGYDCTFNVNVNPSPTGNLSNLFNQQMTLGTGDFLLTLPVNSTKAGSLTFTDLVAPYTAGAPNIAVPKTPTLQLSQLSSDAVMLVWDDLFTFGVDLMGFEVFKTVNGTTFDYSSPFDTPSMNMSVDPEVSPGDIYDYRVRSYHQYGVTSNLSNLLTVTIPFPAPPSAIQNVSAQDVPDDEGGVLQASWDIGPEIVSSYEVYVTDYQHNSTSNLSAVVSISDRTQLSTLIDRSSIVIDSSGQQSGGLDLVDGHPYFLSVVGVDEFGNKSTEVTSVGPVYSRNDSVRTPDVILDVKGIIEFDQGQFALQPYGQFEVGIIVSTDSVLTPGLEGYINLTHTNYTNTFTGVTDENGSFVAFETDNLSQFFNSEIIIGEITIDYGILGTMEDSMMQPVSAFYSSQNVDSIATTTTNYPLESEIDAAGMFEINLSVDSSFAPTFNLSGIVYNYSILDSGSNVVSIGQIESNSDGKFTLTEQELTAKEVYFEISSMPEFVFISTSSFVVSLALEAVEQNNTNTNETGNQTDGENNTVDPIDTDPTTISDVTLNGCASINQIAGDDFMEQLKCTVVNPNSFAVDVQISFVASNQFTGSTTLSTIYVQASGQKAVYWNLDILEDVESLSEETGDFVIRMTTISKDNPELTSTEDFIIPFVIEPKLEPQPESEEGMSSAVILVGAVGGIFLIIAIIAGLILRGRDSIDFSEDEEDWMDEMPDRDVGPVEELPVGMSLDELKSRGKELPEIDEEQKRERLGGDLINEVSEMENDDEVVEETVEEVDESSDDGISVDEYGTEWYEDETGVWWYREAGQEDWSEFQS